MTFHPFSSNFFEILDGHFSWQAQYLVRLDNDTCCSAQCDVSYVTRIHHENHFSWQAQYLVMLEGGRCCSAHCKRHFMCDKDLS